MKIVFYSMLGAVTACLSTQASESVTVCVTGDTCFQNESKGFALLGEILDHKHDKWSRYSAILSKYPTAAHCVQRELSNLIFLSEIDFSKFQSFQELEVCFSRIASLLGEIELTERWMLSLGFEVASFRPVPIPQNPTEEYLVARIGGEDFKENFPSLFRSLDGRNELQVQIGFLSNGEVSDVNVHRRSK